MAKIYATTDPQISLREEKNMVRARRIAAEGMVLLKNDGILPLQPDGRCLAVFGSGARKTVKGGTGSGDVNSRTICNVEQGLEEAGFVVGTRNWMERHDAACLAKITAYQANFMAAIQEKGMAAIQEVLADPYRDPDEPEIFESDFAGTDRRCAIYVLARTSGEGSDRKAEPGDYELSEQEIANLKTLTTCFEHTIVVLNVGGVIDTKFLRSYPGISAVLLMSQPGNIAGQALADVLTGKVTPSGHLTTTWAENYTDYACADTFGSRNGDVADEYYYEGIYVGYRYFDSFGINPAYPFGYGLSYTQFTVTEQQASISGENILVNATVKNIGSQYCGQETVQVYVSQPQGKLDKPYQVLAGFTKTKLLSPGEEEAVAISFSMRSLAAYSEKSAAYVLEEGNYYIRLGTHSRNTHIVAVLHLGEDVVTEQLKNCIQPDADFDLIQPDVTRFYTYPGEDAEKEAAPVLNFDPAAIASHKADYATAYVEMKTEKERLVTMEDVLMREASLEDIIAQLSVSELTELVVGTSRGGFGTASTIGAASAACPGAAGDTTSALLDDRGVPNLVLADGPAGLRLSRSFVADSNGNIIPGLGESAMGGIENIFGGQTPDRPADAVDYYQYCTAIPIATMLAQTWNPCTIEEAGDIVGGEMEDFGVTLWLAPGMNIHRNPLCGRNFEYYSEDPLISGICAAADTKGVQRHLGCGTTIKHFALNNQEDNRSHCNSHCSERAIREIYLKGFEIAVKESAPLSLMTSYNLLNGLHTANHKELLTDILRSEWGFDGLVMTDWGTTGGGDMNPAWDEKYGTSDPVECIRSGNDLIMPGSQEDFDAIVNAVGSKLKLSELQICAKRVLALTALRKESEQAKK